MPGSTFIDAGPSAEDRLRENEACEHTEGNNTEAVRPTGAPAARGAD